MTNDVVKSVRRVVEVLELFRTERQALNATDIGARLAYPKSSCNALLKSMVSLGYMSIDSRNMKYFPTLRVTNLGDWLPAELFGEERMTLLEELHAETGETVTLSVRNGFHMQFVTVIPGTFPMSLALEEGLKAPLLGTAVGIALLSTYSEDRINNLFARVPKNSLSVAHGMTAGDVREEVLEARRTGYAQTYDRIFPDTGAVAMPVPMVHESNLSVVGVGGLASRIHSAEKQIIEIMRTLIVRPGD